MPRYFFNVLNNGSHVEDHIGHHLADDNAANVEALSFADFLPDGSQIIVKDEVGRVVCEILSAQKEKPERKSG